jgi:hypothetical protein
VTYTVTFSEDMDASTVDAADFGNEGSSTITVGSITETSPGVFSVVVTPTSVGTLQLKINADAVLTDAVGNALDTTSAIPDDTTLTVGTIQIVNIDFNGLRPGDAGHAGTYVGVSAAGSGTVFNPITADSTGGNDNLTVSASGLIDETGTSTAVAFSISPVGGDNEPDQTFGPASLYDDFIFNHGAGNTAGPAGSPFTISGLGDSPTADVYFYLSSYNYIPGPTPGQISISGVVGNGVDGTYNGLRATRFLGVPVSGGSITGFFGSNGAQSVLAGLTVVSVNSQALEPEIAVEQPAGTDITSGGSRGFGTVTLGSNTSLEFTIKNTGTSALNLTGTPPDHVVVGGTNPGDFTVTSQPSTPVSSGGGTTTFTVQFAPGAAGARSATLTIANNDSDEGSFVINVTGTGQTPYQAWLAANGKTNTPENLREFAFGTTNTGPLVLNGAGTSIVTRGQAPVIQTTVGSAVVTLTYARRKNSGCTYSAEFSTDLSTWLASTDPSLIYPPGAPAGETVVDNGDEMEIVSIKFPLFRNTGSGYVKMEQNFCRTAVTNP